MTVDPMDALVSFQDAYTAGLVKPQRGEVHAEVGVFHDMPRPNSPRWSYVLVQAGEVMAFANLSRADPLDGKAVFQIGYAVPPTHRGKGLGRQIAKAAVDEFDNGMRRNNAPMCYIEASVVDTNAASHKVAKAVFGAHKQTGKDERTGEALKLYRKAIGKRPFEV